MLTGHCLQRTVSRIKKHMPLLCALSKELQPVNSGCLCLEQVRQCVCMRSVLTNIAERPTTAGSAASKDSAGGGGNRKAPRSGHVRMSEPRRSSLVRRRPESSEADVQPAGACSGIIV